MSGVFPIEVRLSGCDDETRVTMNVTEDEYGLLEVLAAKTVKESNYGCMPIIELKKLDEDATS